ncbi:hemolysin activation protein [Escherichia coli]
MTRQEWLLCLRRCTSRDTLEKVIEKNKYDLTDDELEPFKEGANKQIMSSQADSLIKISRIWADFFPANTSNQPV